MNKKILIIIITLAILAVLSLFYTALAHDYWLSPERFAIARGDTLIVNLLVGDQLNPEIERPLQKEMGEEFLFFLTDDVFRGTSDFYEEIVGCQNGSPQHVHKQQDEVLYVVEGEVRIILEGKIYDLKAGDSVFYSKRNLPLSCQSFARTSSYFGNVAAWGLL